jgi:short-subunit dehydrogenase
MKDLRDRTVLLTGASAGIGPYIARRLRAEGARLILTARRQAELDELAAELGDARVITADLSDRAELERLITEAGEVDVLVANAGVEALGQLATRGLDEIDTAIDVNLRAPIVLTRLCLPAMIRRGSGHVVLVASLAGKVPAPGSSLYSATKAGLRAFAHATAAELRGTGVGVAVVSPTFVEEAGMYARGHVKAPGSVRTVNPSQVAESVVKAIRGRRVEIVVAPVEQRVFGRVVQAMPELVGMAASAATIPSSKRKR